MTASPTQVVLSRLRGVRPIGVGKWRALCPAHDDQHHSLSVGEGYNGRALVHCHTGCAFDAIVASLGLEKRDFFPHRTPKAKPNPAQTKASPPLTVAELAQHFRLNPSSLRGKGVSDCRRGVAIQYFDIKGQPLGRSRLRLALSGSERFRWRGRGPVQPYGLQFIRIWTDHRPDSFLILVEGESDCWAAWEHGVPALGIPGATLAGCLRPQFVAPFRRIYILREPDDGGDAFLSTVPVRLANIGWSGELFELRLDHVRGDRAKDLAELHIQDPARFDLRLRDAIQRARAIPLPKIDTQSVPATPRRLRGAIREDAQHFLMRYLEDGDWYSGQQLKQEARKKNISGATLRRAAKSLPIEKRPCGFRGQWMWRLNPQSSVPLSTANTGRSARPHKPEKSSIYTRQETGLPTYVGSEQVWKAILVSNSALPLFWSKWPTEHSEWRTLINAKAPR
jgi:hypothetical protein